MDPWINLLEKLPLNRTERAVYKRYKTDPKGRTFLSVAEILRVHGKVDESMELLTQGVGRHPDFSVARVVLARELFLKGMIGEGWQTLQDSPEDLTENILAQKLKVRLGILLGATEAVSKTFQAMKKSRMFDGETKQLMELYEMEGLGKARQFLVDDLMQKGVSVFLPKEWVPKPAEVKSRGSAVIPPSLDSFESIVQRPELRDVGGFNVVPLDEIFQEDGQPKFNAQRNVTSAGVELDSTTLADIYAKQGHFNKALAVYKRLLRLSPNNDLLRRKVADTAKLAKEQRESDLQIDPAIVDSMEVVEIIDARLMFYNHLLNKLG